MRPCSIQGCPQKHLSKGFCGKHYHKWKKYGDPLALDRKYKPGGPCSTQACVRPAKTRGLCITCYHLARRDKRLDVRRQGKSCTYKNCQDPHNAKGFCERHYYAWKRHGDPGVEVRKRKGSGHLNRHGYRVVYKKNRPVLEHRVLMEEQLGRRLKPIESVHHRNGQRADNRLSNLELWASSHPPGQRAEDLVAWASEIIDYYGPLFGYVVTRPKSR